MLDNENLNEPQKPQLNIVAVMRRFLFVLVAPIWALNLIFATLMLIPYFIIANKWFFDTKMFKGFIEWHLGLLDS